MVVTVDITIGLLYKYHTLLQEIFATQQFRDFQVQIFRDP